MFLPVEVGRHIVDFSYTDSSGASRKLVRSVEILNSSKERPPVLSAPPRRWPGDLLLGMLPAALVPGLRVLRKKRPLAGRIVWGIFQGIVGLALGILGFVLVYALYFMKNDYIQQNINLLFVNPLLLAAAPLGLFAAARRVQAIRPEKCLKILWVCVSAAGLLSLLLQVLPFFSQQNQATLAIVLPAAVLLSLGAEFRVEQISGDAATP
jgi:hypothetical protein